MPLRMIINSKHHSPRQIKTASLKIQVIIKLGGRARVVVVRNQVYRVRQINLNRQF